MNFTLKAVQDGCRLGSLVSQAQEIVVETPTCMLYTKMGASRPHNNYLKAFSISTKNNSGSNRIEFGPEARFTNNFLEG